MCHCALMLGGRLGIEKMNGGMTVVIYFLLFLFSVIVLNSVLEGKVAESERELDGSGGSPCVVEERLVRG